jgi:hypothetical protein
MAGQKGRSGGKRAGAGRPRLDSSGLSLRGSLERAKRRRVVAKKKAALGHATAKREIERLSSELERTAKIAAELQQKDEASSAARSQMPAMVQAVIEELLPLAKEAGSISPRSMLAFRELCELIVTKRRIFEEILHHGFTLSGGRANPLLARYTTIAAQVQAGLDRFGLSADETGAGSSDDADDPLDEFDPQAEIKH